MRKFLAGGKGVPLSPNTENPELCMKTYSNWYYTWSPFGVLAKENNLGLNMNSKLLNIESLTLKNRMKYFI